MSTFETPRLIARRWRTTDLDDLAEMYGDIRVMRWLGSVPKTHSRDEVKELMELRISQLGDWPEHLGSWGVIEKQSGKLIGCTILKSFPEDQGAPEVEVGYHFNADYWGNGYATEIARATIERGFALGPELDYIMAVTYPENLASQRVLLKCGLRLLGTSNQYYKVNTLAFRIDRPQ